MPAKYTIFKTKWGYFGLLANEKGLLRSCLPCPNPAAVKRRLLTGLGKPEFVQNLLKSLQKQIIAYFEDRPQSSVVRLLSSVPIALNGLPPFTQKVLAVCKNIPAGKTITYSHLACLLGNPRAARAVGNALAKNPIPLIIPCHRVIRSDGKIGNFSAPGGSKTKKKLIELEKS